MAVDKKEREVGGDKDVKERDGDKEGDGEGAKE